MEVTNGIDTIISSVMAGTLWWFKMTLLLTCPVCTSSAPFRLNLLRTESHDFH